YITLKRIISSQDLQTTGTADNSERSAPYDGQAMTNMATGQLPMRLAALDLGSNSFHLLVAERAGARWRPVQRLGEKVQLAAGMRDGELQADAIERGLACLRRFLPLLRDLPANCVRVVGTQALRTATNRDAFLKPAQTVLQR